MARVLLVDDDAEQLYLRTLLLQHKGHLISSAGSLAAAIALLEEFRPDVVVMDLCMPELKHGLELIRMAAASPAAPRILVLSGWPEKLDERPEARLVAGVLSKPAPLGELLEAIGRLALLCLLLLFGPRALNAQTFRFTVAAPAEVAADLDMSSPGSDWSRTGREAALAVLTLDGRSTQHVMLYAGEEFYTYPVFLGALAPGAHELRVERHAGYSARGSGLAVRAARFREVPRGHPDWPALAHAPILHARAGTVGAFTDVPLAAWCERLEENGRALLQYTVIFSNEDGGTSTRALMARWGRTTDIEYIYRAWLDEAGGVARATIQARDHKEIAFRGRREGAHPVLIPSTRNNMVSAEGSSPIRYQLAPVPVDLHAHAREEAMDGLPVTYRVMAQELEREDKLRPFGAADGEKISDPRNYLYFEMKIANRHSALAVLARVRGEPLWRSSHLGRGDYALSRDGWVRTTVELPPGTGADHVEELAFACLTPPAKAEPPAGSCRIEAVSKVFRLGADYVPGPGFFRLNEPFDLPTGLARAWPVSPPAGGKNRISRSLTLAAR